MRQWFRDHSLSIVFGALTLISYLCRQIAAFYEWDDTTGGWREQIAIHGEGTWEMFQFWAAVLFTKWFRERGSAESKNDEDAR